MRLTPRNTVFYDLFASAGDNIARAAHLLAEALAPDADRAGVADRLRSVEHSGDEITHDIIRRVNSSFVTPLDREDIYRLASALDDILDEMEAAVDQMVLYRVGDLPLEMAEMIDVLQRMSDLTAAAMPRLRIVGDLREYWVEINRLENLGDQIYRRLLAHLFSGSYEALEVMKLKDVGDSLEGAADAFEHVANTVEAIALKES